MRAAVELVCCLSGGLLLFFGTLIAFIINAAAAYKLARRFLVEQPPDAILLDIGRALLAGLRQAGLVSRNLHEDYVRVVEQPDQSCEVLLDYASPRTWPLHPGLPGDFRASARSALPDPARR